jgi:hypothetical protein
MKRKPRPPKNDLSGQKFGYLKVLRMEQTAKSKYSNYRAICLCDCGKEHETAAGALTSGRTKSCGCDKSRYKKTRGKNNPSFTGYEEIGGKLWSTIKRRARNRHVEFAIDIKDAWELFIKQNRNCALSGLPIVFGISSRRMSESTASLDRIDSSMGYLLDNVQWVHKTVNIMKNTLPNDFFVAMCQKIADHSKVKERVQNELLSQNMFTGEGLPNVLGSSDFN